MGSHTKPSPRSSGSVTMLPNYQAGSWTKINIFYIIKELSGLSWTTSITQVWAQSRIHPNIILRILVVARSGSRLYIQECSAIAIKTCTIVICKHHFYMKLNHSKHLSAWQKINKYSTPYNSHLQEYITHGLRVYIISMLPSKNIFWKRKSPGLGSLRVLI